MGSKLFKQFIKKSILRKQGPPGPPPRQGLQWKPQTHRWIRPGRGEGFDGDPTDPRVHEVAPRTREENINTDPDFADGKYEQFVADQDLSQLMEVHGDDVTWEMEGSRGDPEAWIDERTELIVSLGSTENPKSIRNKIEDQFNENLVEQDVSGGFSRFPDLGFDDDDDDYEPKGYKEMLSSEKKASQTKNFFRGLAEEYNTSELREDFSESRTDYGPFDTDTESETIDFYAWLEGSIRDDLWGGKFEDKLESMGIDSQNEKQLEGFLSQGIKNYARAQGDIINPMTGRLK